MHSRELVELAALVAVHAPVFVRRADRPPQTLIEEYWAASRCRLDRWTRLLKRLADASTEIARPAALAWSRIAPALEEILASELLVRIWTAAATAHDRARDDTEIEPVARSIFNGHEEARRRLLHLMADGRVLDETETDALELVRRRAERWCDMLLAHLARDIDITQFAFDPARAIEFAEDLDYETTTTDRHFTAQLVLGSLKASFDSCLSERSPNYDLNRRIAAAILGCFGEQLFEADDSLSPLWLDRMHETADSAQGLLDELAAFDSDPAAPWRA